MQQLNGVDTPLLADSIDAADPLLEPQWIPRQLEVHDKAAARLQVQTLSRGVGCHQRSRTSLGERGKLVPALGGRESAVEHGDGGHIGDSSRNRADHVAVFAEHDERLAGSPQQATNDGDLRRSSGSRCRQRCEPFEPGDLPRAIVQPRNGQYRITWTIVIVALVPRQGGLRLRRIRSRQKG